MYLPNVGLVVIISLHFLDKYTEYSKVTIVCVIASRPGPLSRYKVDIIFEMQ
jgi:hypothetical protein